MENRKNRICHVIKLCPWDTAVVLKLVFSLFSAGCVCSVGKSCLTLCDPMDSSSPGFFVHGILQARILEQVAISFFRGSSQPRDWTHVSFISWISVCACWVSSVMSDSLWSYGLEPTRLLCPWDSPGKNTGVDCHALFQGILHWQVGSFPLNHLGSPLCRLDE